MAESGLKLQAFIQSPNGDSDYRFLVDGTNIKYISIADGALPSRSLISSRKHLNVRRVLPPFPKGIWNQGHIVKCPRTSLPVFSTTSLRGDFPGVRHTWHPVIIDHLDLTWVTRIRQHVGVVTCPQFRGRVVYKYAPFPWMVQGIEQETTVWKSISEHRGDADYYWAPHFLGHVSEEGRVIGLLLEFIPGRPATGEGDWEACCKALESLHARGITHGDVRRDHFVIRKGEGGDEAMLVGLSKAVYCQDAMDFVEERAQLGRSLRLGNTTKTRDHEDGSGRDE